MATPPLAPCTNTVEPGASHSLTSTTYVFTVDHQVKAFETSQTGPTPVKLFEEPACAGPVVINDYPLCYANSGGSAVPVKTLAELTARLKAEPGKHNFGSGAISARVAGELYRMQLADRLHEPVLTQWDPWGNRIDEIELSPLWQRAAPLAARSGLVAIPYEAKHGRYASVHQFASIYLFHPSTDVYTCPLAMTDGAVRCLVAHSSVTRREVDAIEAATRATCMP